MSHLLSFDAPVDHRESFHGVLNWRILLALLLNIAAWVAVVRLVLGFLNG